MKKLVLSLFFIILFINVSGIVLAECAGGTDLDINKIERAPGQSTFKVVATANGNGDCLRVAWTKDNLNSLLNQASPEEITSNDITGDISITSQKDTFHTTIESDKKVLDYDTYNHGWTLGSCDVDSCKSWGYSTTQFAIRTFSWPGPCYCVYTSSTEIATFGIFSGVKDRNGKAVISFSGLTPQTIDFGEQDGTVNIDNKITASWRGDLLGGHWVGTPGYNTFKDSSGAYHLTSQDFDSINNALISANEKTDVTIRNCLGESDGWKLSGISEATNCISAYNQKLNELLIDRKNEYISGNSIVKSASFVGSDFVVDEKPYSTAFPQFTLTFDAAWAGVHWITGQPKVTCPSDDSFTSGESKNLNLNVENVANEKGAFSLSLDCDGLSATLNDNKLLLDARKSQTTMAQVTYSTDSSKISKCTFKVYATRDPSKADECSFNVEVKPLPKQKTLDVNQSVVTSYSASSLSEKSSSSTLFWIILLILIACAIGIYVYTKNKRKNGPASLKNSESSSLDKHCTKCGHLLKVGSLFCTHCGQESSKEKS